MKKFDLEDDLFIMVVGLFLMIGVMGGIGIIVGSLLVLTFIAKIIGEIIFGMWRFLELSEKRKRIKMKKFSLEEIFYKGILWVPINIFAKVLLSLINAVQALQEMNVTHVLQGIKAKAIVLYKKILKER